MSHGLLPVALILGLLLGILSLLFGVRLLRRRRLVVSAPAFRSEPAAERAADPAPSDVCQLAIAGQMDAIERFTKRRLNEMLTSMVESGGWQALVDQVDALSEERLLHMRALANRAAGGLPCEVALRHTLEAYSLSRLMLSLHDQLVAQSAIVTQVMDDWFRAHRHISIDQFEAQLQLDCARILLLDLQYAQPPLDVVREQLRLAEEHCNLVNAEFGQGHRQSLASEIELRRQQVNNIETMRG